MSPSASSFLTSAPADLARAAELLRQGTCVALPTETVYGLAADAGNAVSVAAIFEAKGRPRFNPLIAHVADAVQAEAIAAARAAATGRRRFVILGLALGKHDPNYVDAYYGPDSLKAVADRCGRSRSRP